MKKQVPAADEGMDDSEDEKENNKANGDNNAAKEEEEEEEEETGGKDTPETNGASSAEAGDVAKKSKLEAEVAS